MPKRRKTRTRERFSFVGNCITGGEHSPAAGIPKKTKFTNAPKSDAIKNWNQAKTLPRVLLGTAFGITDKESAIQTGKAVKKGATAGIRKTKERAVKAGKKLSKIWWGEE